MANENLENQSQKIERNPSRFNTNVNQGQTNEKSASERVAESDDQEKFAGNQADANRISVSGPGTGGADQNLAGEKTGEASLAGNSEIEQSSSDQASLAGNDASVKGKPSDAGAGAGYGDIKKTQTREGDTLRQ